MVGALSVNLGMIGLYFLFVCFVWNTIIRLSVSLPVRPSPLVEIYDVGTWYIFVYIRIGMIYICVNICIYWSRCSISIPLPWKHRWRIVVRKWSRVWLDVLNIYCLHIYVYLYLLLMFINVCRLYISAVGCRPSLPPSLRPPLRPAALSSSVFHLFFSFCLV